MTRTLFLTLSGAIALAVGLIATLAPETLLTAMKGAEATPAAIVMARTSGVLLLSFGALNLLVRSHAPTPSLRAILVANVALQALLLPIDPLAWASGTFTGLGSFLPNLILHGALLIGSLVCLWHMPRTA